LRWGVSCAVIGGLLGGAYALSSTAKAVGFRAVTAMIDTPYADPELFASAGADVVVATDFNPNYFSQSMQFAIDVTCHGIRTTPGDALCGVTASATPSLALDGRTGTKRGAPGDLVVADGPDYAHLPYSFGISNTETVLKKGEVVYRAG
jgi:imidazolonepropionase